MPGWLRPEARSSNGVGPPPAETANVETRYRSALAAYVENVDEESQLMAALALGRKLLAEGQGLLDLLTLHHTAIKSMLEPGLPAADIQARLARAQDFLTQVAAPFEMAHLAWYELSERMRAENERLETQVAERAAAHREVTERLDQARHDLLTSEEKWQALVENPIIGISFLDGAQRFVAANRTLQTMLAYSNEELLRMSPLDIGVEGEREVNKRLFQQLQRGEREYYDMIKQLRRKDGQLIWVQLYVFAIRDQASGALHTFELMLDITERRRAQSALQDAQAEIARVARMNRMGAMTASIAHEIAQPLGAMVSNANAGLRWLSQATPDFDEVRAVLENIVRAGHRASDIIQGIRALFKESPQTRTVLDLNQLIGEVLSLAQREFEKHTVIVDIRLDEALPLVTADKVQMQQVIFNLVTNALDAMEPVKDRSRILRIKSAVDSSRDVLIAIEDTGIGISVDDTDRIFSTFFTTKAHGMGMGLSICRSIIESHDGRLWASSGAPHGAIFQIALPVGAP
jgi:PAS domain S-box-containing protein